MLSMTATLLLGALSVAAGGQAIDATVECPVGLETRIVFPEPVIELRTPPAAVVRALRLRVVAAGPKAIISLTPNATPLDAVVVFEGATTTLRVQVVAVTTGKAQEVRLRATTEVAAAPAPAPPPTAATPPPPAPVAAGRPGKPRPSKPAADMPSAVAGVAASGHPNPPTAATRSVDPPAPAVSAAGGEPENVVVLHPVWVAPPSPPPTPSPSSGPSAPAERFDADALAMAQPQRIGREEGLPGRRVVVLEDALRGTSLVWLRFRVARGAKSHLDGVRWEKGDVKSVLIAPDGKDLRVVVQLPRAGVTKDTRVELRVDGEDYRFPVSAPWLSSFLRSLF